MISKEFRFHGHASLKYVFAKGQQARSKFFAIKYIANPHRRYSRLAVVVSKKIFKSAVQRNCVRRRVYEISRPLINDVVQPVDVVISVYSQEVLALTDQELRLQILPLLHQAGFKRSEA